jgi:uncharacterized membrane protein HdeD (DUF308 family)
LVRLFHVGLQELRRHWGWFLVLGIVLLLLGTFAILYAVLATITTVLIFGWVLVFDGLLHGVAAFWARQWSGFFLHLLTGVLSVVVGAILIRHPVEAGLTLTLLLAAFFIVSGVFRIIAPLVMQFPSGGWVVLGGVINLILGLLIWNQWPASGLWVIGMFVGIDLIFRGWSYVMFALALRSLPAS